MWGSYIQRFHELIGGDDGTDELAGETRQVLVTGDKTVRLAHHGKLQEGRIKGIATSRGFGWRVGYAHGSAPGQIVGQTFLLFIRREFELGVHEYPDEFRRSGPGYGGLAAVTPLGRVS